MSRLLSALLALGVTAVAVVLLSLRDGFFAPEEPFPRVLPVTVFNERQNTHIWLDDRVSLQVWEVDADASQDPLAGFSGSLDLPGNRLGSGFYLERGASAEGSITLPEDVDLGKYLRRGCRINLSVFVVPNGFHSEAAPFSFRPDVERAFGSIPPAAEPIKEPVRLYHLPN